MMTLEAEESAVSLLLIVRAWLPALMIVKIRPLAPPAIPVKVWDEVPVKRTKAPVIDSLFNVPVVDISDAAWKATLPALVTVKLLEAVVAPCSAMPPEPAAIATPPVLLVLPMVVTALPLTLMLVVPCKPIAPEPAAIATPPVLLVLPMVVTALPLTLMFVAPRILAVELALPRETVPL